MWSGRDEKAQRGQMGTGPYKKGFYEVATKFNFKRAEMKGKGKSRSRGGYYKYSTKLGILTKEKAGSLKNCYANLSCPCQRQYSILLKY